MWWFLLFYVKICMPGSHSGLTHVFICDQGESYIKIYRPWISQSHLWMAWCVPVTLWSRSPGQRPVCPLLGDWLSPQPGLNVLCPVELSVIGLCDLNHFSHLTYTCSGPCASFALSMSPQDIIFPRQLISFAKWKITPDICDYSNPLNSPFLLYVHPEVW